MTTAKVPGEDVLLCLYVSVDWESWRRWTGGARLRVCRRRLPLVGRVAGSFLPLALSSQEPSTQVGLQRKLNWVQACLKNVRRDLLQCT